MFKLILTVLLLLVMLFGLRCASSAIAAGGADRNCWTDENKDNGKTDHHIRSGQASDCGQGHRRRI